MSAPRNALDLPLSGVRVVEASAGTGKTFAIATLYLRLVLEQALTPEQIVVATFTRAATAELSSRLRERLRLASQLLVQPDPAMPRDDDNGDTTVTRAVIAQALSLEGVDAAVLQHRARDAERAMDTAMIGTLHGFCNRVSSEFGFETGHALTPPELLDDLRTLQNEIIDDFWRAGSADADAARVLTQTWGSPRALSRQATDPRWRGREITLDETTPETMQMLREQRGAALAWLDALRNSIAGWNDATMREADTELAACFPNKSARESRVRGLRAVRGWAISSMASWPPSGVVDKAAESFSPDAVRALSTCPRPPQGPAFQAMIDLGKTFADLHTLDAAASVHVLRNARAFLERELPARLRGLGKIGHDQAVDELARALDDTKRGARAIDAIRKRWPAALVDEFQDTDPAQCRILQKLFAHATGTLVLVGDPKQAIYGFRGGDVHAYLAARACADGEPMRLDESQRAGAAVDAAINALFSREHAFAESAITHPDVRAAPRVARRALLLDGRPAPGLQLWRLPPSGKMKKDGAGLPWNKSDAQCVIERACVTRIVELLAAAQQGNAQLRDGDGALRPLQAGDLAVLVNDNAQAYSMQRALARASVPAASCLRASVYASDEAGDLLLLLEALRDPADARRARAAQTSVLIGMDARQIAISLRDATALDALLEQTAIWASQVEHHGPLAWLHALIAQVAPRLLATPGGERRVANYLQLAELLQQQADACFGIDDLCGVYARALADADTNADSDAARLRLETDAQAVQIATVHAAKGLEYGVVFLPYAALGKQNTTRRPTLTWYHDTDRACVAIGEGVSETITARAQNEILAEEERKFYVGVTRTCAACVLPWGWINQGRHSAAHWLLHQAGRAAPLPFDDAGCERALEDLRARAPEAIAIEALPGAPAGHLPRSRDNDEILSARRFDGHIERDWCTWSFSRLVRGGSRDSDADPRPGAGDEMAVADNDSPTANIQTLPTLAGARFGSAVHAALECADFSAWHGVKAIPETQRDLLER
ncbi:MAG: UvrD-helicase domain-containing protein, partial [Pseudomonadota bacterium]|nr:UvrD-helicase domain-containing protein [Pseudomonadota bacterium]